MAIAIAFAAGFLVQLAPAQSPPVDTILVSRQSLVILSPIRDASAAATRPGPSGEAEHTLIVDITKQSSWLRLSIPTPVNPAIYASPRRPVSCRVLIDTYSCRDSTTVEIANGRLVITVRDSAMIALLFDGRPSSMSMRSDVGHAGAGRPVVRYVDPQLAPPSSEALAEHDRALGREGWSPWTRRLSTTSFVAQDTAWMQVGDSIRVLVWESQCRPVDTCNSREDFSASGWTSSDPTVVALRESGEPRRDWATIVALRPGSATVAVHGLRGPSDDLPRSRHSPTMTRHITVTNRWTRLQITPRPTRIIAGSPITLEARLIDEFGAVLRGAPVSFIVIYDWPDDKDWASKRYENAASANLSTPGHRRFIARFGSFVDTLDLEVVPRAVPR